jgi:hypothetical protein
MSICNRQWTIAIERCGNLILIGVIDHMVEQFSNCFIAFEKLIAYFFFNTIFDWLNL